jgi:aldose 1-epimerase
MIKSTAPVLAELFGQTPDGQSAMVYTLESAHLRVRITNYGGRIVSIEVPDRLGRRGDVRLGFDDVAAYVKAGGAFGALLGRNANRIASGSFTLDGRTYHLPANDGISTLHGGPVGFTRFSGRWPRQRPSQRWLSC